MKKILVLYHKDCPDGFGGAFAVWKKFGNKAEYLAANPSDNKFPIKYPNGKEIYIIDIGYSEKVLRELIKINKSVVVIDHHISRKNDLEKFKQNVFDNNHSGSVLAWKYFHTRKNIPKLLLCIEDRDLWKLKIRNAREIISTLRLVGYDFKKWDAFSRALETKKGAKNILSQGKVISLYEEGLTEKAVKNAVPAVLDGHKAMCVNSTVLSSGVGHVLCKSGKYPLAIIWMEDKDGICVSLRANGMVDTSKIAAKYGGGGHRGASGFRLKRGEKFPWKIL